MSAFLIAVTFTPGGLYDRLVWNIRAGRAVDAARLTRQLVRHLRANGALPDDLFDGPSALASGHPSAFGAGL